MGKKLSLLAFSLIFFLTACGGSDKNQGVGKAKENAEPLTKGTIVELKDFSFELVDFEVVKSQDDNVKDALLIAEKSGDAVVDNAQLGFDLGATVTDNAVMLKDAFLILKVKYSSKGDSVIPKMEIKSEDDKEELVFLIHNSMKEKQIQEDSPHGILLFKIFASAKTAYFTFDGKPYELKLK